MSEIRAAECAAEILPYFALESGIHNRLGLAELLGLSRATCSRACKELETFGWVAVSAKLALRSRGRHTQFMSATPMFWENYADLSKTITDNLPKRSARLLDRASDCLYQIPESDPEARILLCAQYLGSMMMLSEFNALTEYGLWLPGWKGWSAYAQIKSGTILRLLRPPEECDTAS